MFTSCIIYVSVLQAVFWLVLPKLIREERIKLIMTILLLIFLFQFLPKVYHSICLMRRMQKVTGYIFGTIWWGFGLNLIAYFIASHVSLNKESYLNSWSFYFILFFCNLVFHQFIQYKGRWRLLVCPGNTTSGFVPTATLWEKHQVQSLFVMLRGSMLPVFITFWYSRQSLRW